MKNSCGIKRPNIIFIMTDDQGYWALGCAGNKEIKTPNLDRLAESGIRFTNCFCVSPVCSPARASILTGKIPSQHGIHDWIRAGNSSIEKDRGGKLVEYLSNQIGYTDIMADNGYTCGLAGKWHLGDAHHKQKGFSYWETHAQGGGPYYNAPMISLENIYNEPKYITDAITDKALDFLDTQHNNVNPFYLGIHYTAPHSPWEREHHPADIFDDYYNNCPFESVPDGLPVPDWVERVGIPVKDQKTRRTYLSGYYTAVTVMDYNVGRVLDWLDDNNLREDTLIVFTSDNGMNMGHHGVFGKGNATYPMNMYETSVKVPAIFSHPQHIPANHINDILISHYDFFHTLLNYIQIPYNKDESFPGESFCNALENKDNVGDNPIVVYDEYGPVRMIRNNQFKYIHRYCTGPNEFYNLDADPNEEHNLINDKQMQPIIAEMKLKMVSWFERYVVPEKDGKDLSVNGLGQMDKLVSATRQQHDLWGPPYQ